MTTARQRGILDGMPLALDPVLLEVLACPDTHHAPLRTGTDLDPDAEVLTCTECRRSFPVRDGIPVLLLDAAIDDAAAVNPADDSTAAAAAGPTDGGQSEPR